VQKRRQSGCLARGERAARDTSSDPSAQVREQHRRAGSPGHQTSNAAHAGVQGFSVRTHHGRWHRDHAYDLQGADEMPQGKSLVRSSNSIPWSHKPPRSTGGNRPSVLIATEPPVPVPIRSNSGAGRKTAPLGTANAWVETMTAAGAALGLRAWWCMWITS
jgi:hypothetical protein